MTKGRQMLSKLHRVHDLLVHHHTKTANQRNGFSLEFGVGLTVGFAVIKRLAPLLLEHEDLPPQRLSTDNSSVLFEPLDAESHVVV